jgi:hypothetical protein
MDGESAGEVGMSGTGGAPPAGIWGGDGASGTEGVGGSLGMGGSSGLVVGGVAGLGCSMSLAATWYWN